MGWGTPSYLGFVRGSGLGLRQLFSAPFITCNNQLRVEEAGVLLQLVIVDVASVWVHLWNAMDRAQAALSSLPAVPPKLAPAIKDKMSSSTCPKLFAPLCHENRKDVPGQDLRVRCDTRVFGLHKWGRQVSIAPGPMMP